MTGMIRKMPDGLVYGPDQAPAGGPAKVENLPPGRPVPPSGNPHPDGSIAPEDPQSWAGRWNASTRPTETISGSADLGFEAVSQKTQGLSGWSTRQLEELLAAESASDVVKKRVALDFRTSETAAETLSSLAKLHVAASMTESPVRWELAPDVLRELVVCLARLESDSSLEAASVRATARNLLRADAITGDFHQMELVRWYLAEPVPSKPVTVWLRGWDAEIKVTFEPSVVQASSRHGFRFDQSTGRLLGGNGTSLPPLAEGLALFETAPEAAFGVLQKGDHYVFTKLHFTIGQDGLLTYTGSKSLTPCAPTNYGRKIAAQQQVLLSSPIVAPTKRSTPSTLSESADFRPAPTVFDEQERDAILADLRSRGMSEEWEHWVRSGARGVVRVDTPTSSTGRDSAWIQMCSPHSNSVRLVESRNLVVKPHGPGVFKLKGAGKRPGFSKTDNAIARALPAYLRIGPSNSKQTTWAYMGAQTQAIARAGSLERSKVLRQAIAFLAPDLLPAIPKILQVSEIATVDVGGKEVPYVDALGSLSLMASVARTPDRALRQAGELIECMKAQLATQYGDAVAKRITDGLDAVLKNRGAGALLRENGVTTWLKSNLPELDLWGEGVAHSVDLAADPFFQKRPDCLPVGTELMLYAQVFCTLLGNPCQTLEWEPGAARNADIYFIDAPKEALLAQGEPTTPEAQLAFLLGKAQQFYEIAQGPVELVTSNIESSLSGRRVLKRIAQLNPVLAERALATETEKLVHMLSALTSANVGFRHHWLSSKDFILGVLTDYTDLVCDTEATASDLLLILSRAMEQLTVLAIFFGASDTPVAVETRTTEMTTALADRLSGDIHRMMQAELQRHNIVPRGSDYPLALEALRATQFDGRKLARTILSCKAMLDHGQLGDLDWKALKTEPSEKFLNMLKAFLSRLNFQQLLADAEAVLAIPESARWQVYAEEAGQ